MTLHLADNLNLPLEAVTRRLAILAMSGAGKSNAAVVLAEAMFDAGIPWVAIDPKGDWWGVRSNKSGKGPGLPIPIFGGLHGDVELNPAAGKIIGELIVDQRLTCVLDVSEFPDRQGMWAFLSELGDTLLHKNRTALHLFLEEADEYLPQKTSEKGNLPRCLGIWQRLVKRGRFRGIGTTQITQRSAALNKDTLYQAEALIAMRVTGKGDRDAIEGWVEHHNAADEIVASLPTLADGEAWVSSPAWLRETKRVRFNRRRTFDSGSTPVLLDGSETKPATLANIDLSVLRTKMAATIEKAKADDPVELRKRIRELEAEQQRVAREQPAPPAKEKRVEVLTEADRALLAKLAESIENTCTVAVLGLDADQASMLARIQDAFDGYLANIQRVIARQREEFEQRLEGKAFQKVLAKLATVNPVPSTLHHAPVRPGSSEVERRPEKFGGSLPSHVTTHGLNDGQQRILNVVAMFEVRGLTPSREAIAPWIPPSGVHPRGGTYGQNIAALRAQGYLDEWRLTEKGRAAAQVMDTGLEAAKAPLNGGQRAIVTMLNQRRGVRFTRESLAEALNLHARGGTYGQNIARLRTMGLIPERGDIFLTEAAAR